MGFRRRTGETFWPVNNLRAILWIRQRTVVHLEGLLEFPFYMVILSQQRLWV